MVQSLKIKVETINKIQTEGIREIEKLGNLAGTTNVSTTNRTHFWLIIFLVVLEFSKMARSGLILMNKKRQVGLQLS